MISLENLISARPKFHTGETEVRRPFQPNESLLPQSIAQKLSESEAACYGIDEDVLRFLAETVDENSKTLETGAGCSTLVFAICKAKHTAITPSETEIRNILEYAGDNDIEMKNVRFIPEPSEQYLPRCDETGFDLVLLDGKHAFPWPIVDWFFTADRLNRGGWMLIDDAQMRSVALLGEFMLADPGWELIRDFSGKTLVFKKVRDNVLDVAWHMQPWTVASLRGKPLGVMQGIRRRLGELMRRGGN